MKLSSLIEQLQKIEGDIGDVDIVMDAETMGDYVVTPNTALSAIAVYADENYGNVEYGFSKMPFVGIEISIVGADEWNNTGS